MRVLRNTFCFRFVSGKMNHFGVHTLLSIEIIGMQKTVFLIPNFGIICTVLTYILPRAILIPYRAHKSSRLPAAQCPALLGYRLLIT